MQGQGKKTAALTASGERDVPTRVSSQESRIPGVGGKASEDLDYLI